MEQRTGCPQCLLGAFSASLVFPVKTLGHLAVGVPVEMATGIEYGMSGMTMDRVTLCIIWRVECRPWRLEDRPVSAMKDRG